jgi:autotransporter-associated beta strand protein
MAATYYWDDNGTTFGFGTAGGTWAAPTTGDSTQGWSTSGTGVLAPGNVTTATADLLNFGTDTASLGLTTGTITVSGTVSAANLTFGAASGPITISGGTIAMGSTTGAFTVNNTTDTIGSAITGTNGIAKAGPGNLILSGTNTYTGATRLNGGTLTLDGNTGTLASTSTITGNGGTFVYDNTNSSGAKTLTFGAVTASTGSTTIRNIQGAADSSQITFASQAGHTVGATLNYVNSGSGASIVRTATTTAFDRSVFLNGSNYAAAGTTGSAITALAYGAYNSGDPSSGSYDSAQNTVNPGQVTALIGSNWLINSTTTVSGTNFGTGTWKFNGGYTLTANTGTTIGAILVTGGYTATVSSGTIRANTTDIVIRTDTGTDVLNLTASVVNFNNTAPTSLTKSGSGTLKINGNSNSYGGNLYVNEGTMQVFKSDGLGFGGNNASSSLPVGTTTVAAGAKLVLSGGSSALTVNEPITLNGGSLENDSTANTVTIDNGIAGLQMTNAGTGYSGTISVSFSDGSATATAAQSSGPINSLTLTGAGAGYTSAPVVTINGSGGGSGAVVTAVLSSVTLNGTANTIGGAGNLIINAVVADGTSSGGFAKIGAGTLTLNGDNTYTGSTTVNGGTLAIGAADRIANTSNLVMSGGTFATGGFNETLGTLTLTANSVIDLGSGSSALVFSDSSGTTWGSSVTLSFINFTDGVDSIRIGTTAGGLSGGQLGQITINGQLAAINSSGFLSISAVPEPSTFAALASVAILGFAALRRRRSHA